MHILMLFTASATGHQILSNKESYQKLENITTILYMRFSKLFNILLFLYTFWN